MSRHLLKKTNAWIYSLTLSSNKGIAVQKLPGTYRKKLNCRALWWRLEGSSLHHTGLLLSLPHSAYRCRRASSLSLHQPGQCHCNPTLIILWDPTLPNSQVHRNHFWKLTHTRGKHGLVLWLFCNLLKVHKLPKSSGWLQCVLYLLVTSPRFRTSCSGP